MKHLAVVPATSFEGALPASESPDKIGPAVIGDVHT